MNLVAAWQARGVHVCVITLSGTASDHFALPAGVSRVALDVQRPSHSAIGAVSASVNRVLALRRAIRDTRAPRVLSFIAGINVLTVLATRGLGLRVVISERNDPQRQILSPAWARLRRFTYRWADVVTANSPGAVDALRSYVPAERIELIPNGVVIPGDAAATRGSKSFVFVGRLTQQKAVDVLLAAFAVAHREIGDWRLTVVGDGELSASLRAQSAKLGLGDAVAWAGKVPDPGAFYRDAAVFVLPSRFEGMPNALLEAMAYGLPSIVTEVVGCADELVVQPGAGRTVPADDPSALAEAMVELARNPQQRGDMAAAALRTAQARSVQAILPLWDRVLGLPPAGAAPRAGTA
jgi:glycosyltransferase involved in cell wall biosynthesis